MIGGELKCNDQRYGELRGERNPNSYLWSLKKKKWLKGPQYDQKTKFAFHYSCGVALNSTAILFIGLLKIKHSPDGLSLFDIFELNEDFPNKYVCIYNFERKMWVEQESLDFTMNDIHYFTHDYNPSCVVEQNKKSSR